MDGRVVFRGAADWLTEAKCKLSELAMEVKSVLNEDHLSVLEEVEVACLRVFQIVE
jgi:hypothetical protein